MLGKPPPPIPQILLSDWTDIGYVITLCFLVLKCLHQFSCRSYQSHGSLSTINVRCKCSICVIQFCYRVSIINDVVCIGYDAGTVRAVFSVTPSLTSSSGVVLFSGDPLWWLDAASRLSSSRLAERVSVSLKSRVSIWITCTQRSTEISNISIYKKIYQYFNARDNAFNRPQVGTERQICCVAVHQTRELWGLWQGDKEGISHCLHSARPDSLYD